MFVIMDISTHCTKKKAAAMKRKARVVKPVYKNEIGHVQMRCFVPEKLPSQNALNMISEDDEDESEDE
jgi:hypothetical protein